MFIIQDITYEYLAFNKYDLVWIIILGVICTAYAFAATIEVMKELSAYFVVLSINMEPVYGIILAFFIFGDSEKMTIGFYSGTLIILAAVFAYPFLSNYLKKRKQLLHF
jgi:drug/metabolite transporter (DMT)-like permease